MLIVEYVVFLCRYNYCKQLTENYLTKIHIKQ